MVFEKGDKFWLGKKFSEEHRRKLSISHLGIEPSSESLQKRRDKMKLAYTEDRLKTVFKRGHIPTPKQLESLKLGRFKGKRHSLESIEKMKAKKVGKQMSEETKRKISFSLKGRKKTEEHIKKVLKSISQKPSSLEKRFMEIIKQKNLPYMYVGNGGFILGGKCPDFININGEKICLETRPRKICYAFDKISPEEYAQKRIEHFAKYGWRCIVIFEDEIKSFDFSSLI